MDEDYLAQVMAAQNTPKKRKRGGLAGIYDSAVAFSVVLVSVVLVSVTLPANAVGATQLGASDSRVAGGVFVPLGAMRLSRVVNASLPAPDVFGLGDRFQVGWIETSPISAQVVNLKSFGLLAVAGFVGKVVAVKPLGLAVDGAPADAVAVNLGSGPHPALVGVVGEGRHSLVEIHSGYHITNIPTLVSGVNPRGLYGA